MTGRTPIDPALRQYLDESAPPRPSAPLSDEEMVVAGRRLMQAALDGRDGIPGLPNQVVTQDVDMSPTLRGRLYLPPGQESPRPVLVYCHGGGWVVGSVATHDPFCRLMSAASGVTLLSVEYRLAPEHPYPAALEDVVEAFVWAGQNAASFNGDVGRIGIGGDSAGANLAVAAAQRIMTMRGAEQPRALMLLYPVTDHPSSEYPSFEENAVGYGLTAFLMRWFWQQYAPGIPAEDPFVSPMRFPHLSSLPATLVATAEYDPLRDEGIRYAERLRAAGVDLTHVHAPDMHHNFPVHPGTVARFRQSDEALRDFSRWLQDRLSRD